MAGEGGVTGVLGCWLLHGVAGAYGAVAAESATWCATGWASGRATPGLRPGLGYPIADQLGAAEQGEGQGCSPAVVKAAGAGGHGCSGCCGMRRSSTGQRAVGQ